MSRWELAAAAIAAAQRTGESRVVVDGKEVSIICSGDTVMEVLEMWRETAIGIGGFSTANATVVVVDE